MTTKVAILDYGVGNLRSVSRGMEKAGATPVITKDIALMTECDGVVLPGVGAFSEGMEKLGILREALCQYAQDRPVLGICLGMQMLLERSTEFGLHEGLGLVPGEVLPFEKTPGMKIPHMGWNTIHIEQPSPLFDGIPEESYVYFVHSFYAKTGPEHTLTTTDYICRFASSIWNGNVYGVQFHPEKSGDTGLAILKNFIGLL
ncbi:imidazole glycerol phosphate synthase subunit HisH [Methanogenium sp. S4BF]|uniref:imidazole glycerol phosphate synthase subunit HisH n=1 Tax=Methanogenium sp. S4BF TaxID=1789226 RepID=UPI002415DB4F|nr:imidazole glycerol phosphate synthase subunit HisH [Methanogenium sp. S4BF]WFN34916.1 imidazole glycerol phosphate synthase subunit HisH [Methanogenium sp. S4BF]